MKTSNIYKQRLLETLEIVKANQKHWDQTDWQSEHECGTCYCYAGFGLIQAYGKNENETQREILDRAGWRSHFSFMRNYYNLSSDQMNLLVLGTNTIADLENIIAGLHND